MSKYVFCWVLGWMLSLSMAYGQKSPASKEKVQDIPPPQAPFVSSVPENGQWTIRRVAPRKEKKEQGQKYCQSMLCVKTGDLKHDTATYTDGSKEEFWYSNGGAFMRDSSNPSSIVYFPGTDEEPDEVLWDGITDLESSGFPKMSWIGNEHYVGAVDHHRKLCYHFLDPENDREAWIAVDTGLPAGIRLGSNSYLFTFEPVPSEPLVLPPEFSAVLIEAQKFDERRRRLEEDAAR